jgi:hypothetical protein
MNSVLTVVTVAAGLLLSLSCAILLEEIFVGSFFRLFFTPQPERSKQKSL